MAKLMVIVICQCGNYSDGYGIFGTNWISFSNIYLCDSCIITDISYVH